MYLLEWPQQGDSNKYTQRMIHKKLFKSIRYSCFRRVHIKFLYSSKFDLTAKSLVTNSVIIMRVLCIKVTGIISEEVPLLSLCIGDQQLKRKFLPLRVDPIFQRATSSREPNRSSFKLNSIFGKEAEDIYYSKDIYKD